MSSKKGQDRPLGFRRFGFGFGVSYDAAEISFHVAGFILIIILSFQATGLVVFVM